jgi:hypothetical protein
MAHPWHHAVRSARLFGGKPEDYLAIHNWFDESKAHLADVRHRALRHHTEGIFLCERLFGVVLENSDGRPVPVRAVGEQHVKDDLGWVPTVKDWLENLEVQPWMSRTRYQPMREERMKRAGPGITQMEAGQTGEDESEAKTDESEIESTCEA